MICALLPLIPIQALLNSVDVAHDVGRGAESANAAAASGFFVFSPQEPYVIVVVAASQLLALTWACYNAAAMARVKGMIIPRLVIIEVVEDFVQRAEDTPYAIDAQR